MNEMVRQCTRDGAMDKRCTDDQYLMLRKMKLEVEFRAVERNAVPALSSCCSLQGRNVRTTTSIWVVPTVGGKGGGRCGATSVRGDTMSSGGDAESRLVSHDGAMRRRSALLA